MNTAQKGFASSAILFLLFAFIFIGAGLYYLFFNESSKENIKVDKPLVKKVADFDPSRRAYELIGKSVKEVEEILGEPVASEKSKDNRKEVRIYSYKDGDSTAMYLYFEDGKASFWSIDEFNGEIAAGEFLDIVDTSSWVEVDGGIYKIKIPKEWRKNVLSANLIEVTPLSQKEVDELVKEDPYNPSYYISFEVKDNPKGVSLKEWATNSNYSEQGINQVVGEVKINGVDAYKVMGNQGEGFVDYYLAKENKIINIGYYLNKLDMQWPAPKGMKQNIIDGIVYSFKLKD